MNHSDDFKLTAVKYYIENNVAYENVCDIFHCSERSLKRWVDRYNTTGSIQRKDRKQGSYKVTNEQINFIREELKKKPDILIKDLHTKLMIKFPNIILNRQYIHELIRDNNITRKRATHYHFPATLRGEARDKKKELEKFFNEIKKFNINDIISIDETSIRPGMMFNYCRSDLGKRCILRTNSNEIFKKYSLIVAINNKKCIAYMIYDEGSVNADRFEVFLKAITQKYSNKLFILDNAQIHKRQGIKKIISDTNNNVLYTLPYSPRLNPIEHFFSQMKHYMKIERAMNLEQLKISVKNAIDKVKKEHYNNYFLYAYDRTKMNKPLKSISTKYRDPKIYKN